MSAGYFKKIKTFMKKSLPYIGGAALAGLAASGIGIAANLLRNNDTAGRNTNYGTSGGYPIHLDPYPTTY